MVVVDCGVEVALSRQELDRVADDNNKQNEQERQECTGTGHFGGGERRGG